MSETFYGIGLGPGDPELITLKALNTLKKVDRIFAPINRDGQSLAGEIIKFHLPEANITYLEIPMTQEQNLLNQAWKQAVDEVGAILPRTGAYVTLGDPLLYGSYLYLYRGLKERFPTVRFVTIPGITGMNAAAARCNYYLTEQDDKLLLLTGKTKPELFADYCRRFETIVIYKPGECLGELIRNFYKICPGGSGIVVEKCGMIGERTIQLKPDLDLTGISYFAIAILHPKE